MCQGTWKQIAPGNIRLFHVGWNFDLSGMLTGYFTEVQTDTVSGDGSTYSGTFEIQNFDMVGNHLPGDVAGTLRATRLTVN